MREVIKTAATVDLAIELALVELGLTREEVTAEIIDYPEKKFFFKKPAKVKVMEIVDDFNVKDLFQEKKEKPQPKAEEKIKKPVEVKEKPQPKQEKPKTEVQEKPAQTEIKEEVIPAQELSEKAKYAIEFLDSVIGQFYKGEYTLVPTKGEKGCVIKIICQDAGALIGRKGETMEALSYITGLAANRSDESFEKISVDVANYREKREKDLQEQAKKIALKVAKTGRAYTFEPMNPYERRLIHATVGEIEGVRSESKGEGGARRVMVMSTAPRKPRNNDRGGKNQRPRNNNRDRKFDKAPTPAQKTRDEKLVDNAGTALYSKIEL